MMSASRSDCRNSSGPSKSRMRMRTAPRPCATWASDPAPPGMRYLPAKRTASSFQAAIAIRGEEDLDRRDAVVGGVGVHVQVDVDQLAADEPCALAAVEFRHGAPERGELAVDRLGVVGDAAPGEVAAGG